MDVANTIVSSSIPILQSSTVSSVQPAAPLFHSSNTHPVESVSNNVLTILPDLSSSPTPVSNDHAFPVLSLPSSSFASTSQPSVSLNIPPNHLQPLTPLNLSVTSDDFSLPTFFTDLPANSNNSHTSAETLSFSPVSTNSFSFPWSGVSHNNRSFDQSYPRSSTPVRSSLPTDFSVKDNLTCAGNPSSSFYNILPGQAHPENIPNLEVWLPRKLIAFLERLIWC